MALNIGIVGLPNVGKTTVFSALTSTPAEIANYPYSTTEPNIGNVNIPDERLTHISEIINPRKEVHNMIEFVDIAGLAKGASQGDGMGNKFLSSIREMGALIHVVRCFEDDDVQHVEGSVNPIRDIETLEIELAFSDLESVERRLDRIGKILRSNDPKQREEGKILDPLLRRLKEALGEGKPVHSQELTAVEEKALRGMNLLTTKEMIYCCNIDENSLTSDNEMVNSVVEYAKEHGTECVAICGKLEAEISELDSEEEKKEFMEDSGLKESGLNLLIRAGYKLLSLETFFTAGEQETRAWTFKKGSTAPECAGVIHSDFQRGFIKAETYHCTDLFELKTEQAIKVAGKLRIEGKEYIVKDGDVILFRFNV